MSAYAHQMEREFSAHGLSSRGGSEMESRYEVESGFYMTSFAAMIFMGALVTVGVLFITLLIALTIFAIYAELNNLRQIEFPTICMSLAMQHIIESQYGRDLNSTMWLVDKYFDSFMPLNDGLDVVLMDLDEFLPSIPPYAYPLMHRLNQHSHHCFEEAKHLKQRLLLRLYIKLQTRGWSLILLSRRPETLRNATIYHLTSAGYKGWLSVIMRLNDEMEMDDRQYLSKRRMVLQKEGFRISGIISSQMDSLTGPFSEQHIFKLPNPMYYCFNLPVNNTGEQK
ncbi:uncharacterized protein At2g39920 isoform X2 [Jatropha curcas]|uniref:uncharacterized protein At2g39920 isoform X2 n=1 Tax=Jatropha curcas TaxID=180498 RepID=UPI0009D70E12|nr:uncharacterized protein At2g39920 isoform X2 [Jatropha curcas]